MGIRGQIFPNLVSAAFVRSTLRIKECFKSCCNLNLLPGRKRKRDLNEDAVPTIFPHQQKKSRRVASECRINKAPLREVIALSRIKRWSLRYSYRSFNAILSEIFSAICDMLAPKFKRAEK